MKNTTWELQGGLTFQLPTPETIDEYNSLAGVRPADPNETGIAVLDDAIENTMYRGPFADIRKAVALAVEKEYSDIPRNRKPHPNAEKAAKNETVFNESEGKYIARVAAEKGVDISSFQPVLDKIVADNAALPNTDKNKIKLIKAIDYPCQRIVKIACDQFDIVDTILIKNFRCNPCCFGAPF